MSFLLSWQTLVFLLPLVVGVVLVGALAFAGSVEGDGDADHAHDGPHAGSAEHPLSILGLGRVPLSVLALSLCVIFGAAGLSSNALLRGLLPGAYGLASLGIAAVAALAGTSLVSRLFARLVPARESDNVRKGDLVGAVGHAIVELTGEDGFLQVKDAGGTVHQVRARSAAGPLPKGARVLLLEHRPEADFYVVEPFDPERDAERPRTPVNDTVR